MTYVLAQCPHCKQYLMVFKKEFNCKIFRHGTLKSNYKQIDPHLSKKKCDSLIENNLIFGCGKPFQLIQENKKWIAVKSDYL